jgi:hypothetical protein
LVLLVIALLCVWAGGYAFLLLAVAAGVVMSGEWLAMCGFSVPDWPVFWMPAGIAAASLCAGSGAVWAGLLLLLAATVAAAVWAALPPPLSQGPAIVPGPAAGPGHRPRELSRQTPDSGVSDVQAHSNEALVHCNDAQSGQSAIGPVRQKRELAFGLPYLGLAAVALPWLRADPVVGLRNTLFVLSIVWASDIGAYMVGRLVGGPKLAPAISPGKTWSGAAGGLISAVFGAAAVAACVTPEISAFHVIGPAILLGIISQAGDLFESALKRHFGVKDSGRIIPGHGGLLDRLDALLAVAPVAALLALTVGRGVVLWR